MPRALTASDRETARPENGGWGQKTASGFFGANYDSRAGKNLAKPAKPHRLAQLAGAKTAPGARYFGFRYYSASLGRFINRDPLEERGGWNLYSGLNDEADDPYAGASGVRGTSWQTEWEQAQDRLLSNTSLPHTTQTVTFSGKKNSGLPGASEQNQKTYSANATGHYAQSGAPGTWLQPPNMAVSDPAAGNIDTNLYIFVGNNPINSIDPNGLWAWAAAVAIARGAAVGAAIDVSVQVAVGTLVEGKSFGQSRKDIDWKSAGVSAAAGATGVGMFSVLKKGLNLYKAAKAAQTAKVIHTAEQTASGVKSVATQTATTVVKEEVKQQATNQLVKEAAVVTGVQAAKYGVKSIIDTNDNASQNNNINSETAAPGTSPVSPAPSSSPISSAPPVSPISPAPSMSAIEIPQIKFEMPSEQRTPPPPPPPPHEPEMPSVFFR